MAMGFTGILLLMATYAVPAVLLFFLVYWAVRLAIRHEKRRMPGPREIADQELRDRMVAERAGQPRARRHRSG